MDPALGSCQAVGVRRLAVMGYMGGTLVGQVIAANSEPQRDWIVEGKQCAGVVLDPPAAMQTGAPAERSRVSFG